MKENQFSNDKVFFHTEKLISVLHGDIIAPAVYELSLSGLCNCSCVYCCCGQFHSDCYLSKEDIDRIIEELKDTAPAVTITGGGEPLTNPHFSYAVEQFGKNGIPVGIITNGLLLKPDSINVIVRFAKFIRVSLDTVQRSQYQALRGIDGDIEKLRDDLRTLSEQKQKIGSKILIGVQIVYVNQSVSDIERTIQYSQGANIDFVQIRPLDNIPYKRLKRNYAKYLSEKAALCALADKYSSESFQVILNENKFSEYESCDVKKRYHKCLGANFTASIGHDMRLYFCCSHIGDSAFCLGNLREKSLKELLYSDKRRMLIEKPQFSSCQTQCRNHQLNKILYELTEMDDADALSVIAQKSAMKTPLHYEFL